MGSKEFIGGYGRSRPKHPVDFLNIGTGFEKKMSGGR